MKRYISILSLTLILASSCEKELGKLPENAKVDGNTIVDENTARIALNGAYYRFANVNATNNYTNLMTLQVYPEMFGGTMGYGYGEMPEEMNIYQSEYFWQYSYGMINAANGVIIRVEALPDEYFTGNSKKEILAEAKFIRAYGHAKLLTYYAQWHDLSSNLGILIRDELVDLKNAPKPRSSVADSYAFILSDLDYAIQNGPEATQNVYASKYAAMALKMRVLMLHGQQADYEAVVDLADDIIDNGGYVLENNPQDLFYTKGLSSQEVILGIRPQQNQEAYFYNRSRQFYPGASSLYAGKPYLASLFAGDPRESWIVGSPTAYFPTVFYMLKYIPEGGSPTIVSESAYPLRLTEVYLLKAEAIARSGGDLDEAKSVLKEILTRAGISDFTALDATDRDEFLVEVYKETARSLVAEDGQSWTALLRLPEATVKTIKPTITDKLQYILPVPNNEFLYNQIFGDQNPGYLKP